MADYDMTPRPDGVMHSEFSGAVAAGAKTFEINLDPEIIDPTWFDVTAQAIGAGVTDVTYGGLSTDKKTFTLNITGAGTLAVSAVAVYSAIR